MDLKQWAASLWPFLARLFMASGTFTPTLVGSGTAGTFTYTSANTVASYRRIGDMVFVQGRITITAIAVAPTTNVTINGLPIAAATTGSGVAGGGAIFNYTGEDFPAGFTQLGAQVDDGGSSIVLIRSGDNTTAARVQGGEIVLVGGLFDIRFAVQYLAA